MPTPDGVNLRATLHRLLNNVFGHPEFRPSQEQVCRTVASGQDVLLVMPTGSGKSLCYQLPGLARGGATLVISPLIALMEDQVAKLTSKKVRAECLHSGRSRETLRDATARYSQGALDFLFVAPERLRTPGFLAMLQKHRPSLIAVDEAHCISQWGHDFRPDYRMLREGIEQLRPTPVIALTATATAAVQRDIARQLALENPARIVEGFRRHNIAIEVVDTVPSERVPLVWSVLKNEQHRPAILYAPSRKQSEELAAELATRYRAAAYHAGLSAERRQSVQQRFLAGDLEVVIATVAFGMGIDKADVRTVIHMAIPGSVEAYYQEIGRAGRDGEPSRAVLMHSYADRHMHDFFFERDYPEPAQLAGLYRQLTDRPSPKHALREGSHLNDEEFDSAFEKLWINGGVIEDWQQNVVRGKPDWQELYELQREHRCQQVELMLRFASSPQCRMSALVRYFGDRSDTRTWCGLCDFCAPETAIAQVFRAPEDWEAEAVGLIIQALGRGQAKSTGKLHSELFPRGNPTRDEFEEILCAMARGALIAITNEVFEKDGKPILYRLVRATQEGVQMRPEDVQGLLLRKRSAEQKKPSRRALQKKALAKRAERKRPDDPLAVALRAWRLDEAKRRKVPAFCIFADRVLDEIASSRPESEEGLLQIRGLGSRLVEQYGDALLKLVAQLAD